MMGRGHVNHEKKVAYAIKRHKAAVSTAKEKNAVKVPVWVRELGITLYVMPGTDVGEAVRLYKERREENRKRLKG